MKENKNLRRINVVVNAQTLYHLRGMAAAAGYGEKDLGRVIDKIVRAERLKMEKIEEECHERFLHSHF